MTPSAAVSPEPSVLGTRAHARASLLTRMLCEVAGAACRGAALSLRETPCVFGSAYGEIRRLDELLSAPTQSPVSPLRFQVSVHNAAAGLLSIATGNRGFSTSLCAGGDTLLAALLEAHGLLSERGGAVLVAVGDERLPSGLGSPVYESMAMGMVLHAEARAGDVTLRYEPETNRETGLLTGSSNGAWREPDWSQPTLAPYQQNPCRGGALLAQALQTRSLRPISVDGPDSRPRVVYLEEQP